MYMADVDPDSLVKHFLGMEIEVNNIKLDIYCIVCYKENVQMINDTVENQRK